MLEEGRVLYPFIKKVHHVFISAQLGDRPPWPCAAVHSIFMIFMQCTVGRRTSTASCSSMRCCLHSWTQFLEVNDICVTACECALCDSWRRCVVCAFCQAVCVACTRVRAHVHARALMCACIHTQASISKAARMGSLAWALGTHGQLHAWAACMCI